MESYEDTYYPESIIGSGRAVYVERNYEMIRNSHFCVFYYDESNAPTNRKSGTKIALVLVLPYPIAEYLNNENCFLDFMANRLDMMMDEQKPKKKGGFPESFI